MNMYVRVAQWLAHSALTRLVAGSSPVAFTTFDFFDCRVGAEELRKNAIDVIYAFYSEAFFRFFLQLKEL